MDKSRREFLRGTGFEFVLLILCCRVLCLRGEMGIW